MAIYRHYPNREAMLDAIADTSFTRAGRTVGHARRRARYRPPDHRADARLPRLRARHATPLRLPDARTRAPARAPSPTTTPPAVRRVHARCCTSSRTASPPAHCGDARPRRAHHDRRGVRALVSPSCTSAAGSGCRNRSSARSANAPSATSSTACALRPRIAQPQGTERTGHAQPREPVAEPAVQGLARPRGHVRDQRRERADSSGVDNPRTRPWPSAASSSPVRPATPRPRRSPPRAAPRCGSSACRCPPLWNQEVQDPSAHHGRSRSPGPGRPRHRRSRPGPAPAPAGTSGRGRARYHVVPLRVDHGAPPPRNVPSQPSGSIGAGDADHDVDAAFAATAASASRSWTAVPCPRRTRLRQHEVRTSGRQRSIWST